MSTVMITLMLLNYLSYLKVLDLINMYTLLLIEVVIPLILLSPNKLIRSSVHLLELTVCFVITCQYSVNYNWTEFLELTEKFSITISHYIFGCLAEGFV